MARIGITYMDVENAAQQLQGRGKNPTVDNIREFLGTGSKSTIAQHLRTWKNQHMPDGSALPQELLALVTGIWEKLNFAADDRIAASENTARIEIEQIAKTRDEIRHELSLITQQRTMLEETLFLKDQEMTQLSNALVEERQKKETLLIQQEEKANQLIEMKNENERLHQLASHIQANLEHYQAAIQKQQIEQNLVLEKQQVFFQEQLNTLERENKIHRQKAESNEQAHNIAQFEITQLKEKLMSAEESQNNALVQLKELKLTFTKNELQLEHEQKNAIVLRDELQQLKQQYQNIYAEKAIMNDNLKRLEILLQQKDDTIELLRQEKIFLLQENAEMKGYLKKLDVKQANLVHAD